MDEKAQLENATEKVLELWREGRLAVSSTFNAKEVVTAMSELQQTFAQSKFGITPTKTGLPC